MDSSDESASERQNLLSKFLETSRRSPAKRQTHRETKATVPATIKLPYHVESHQPPVSPAPKVRRSQREPPSQTAVPRSRRSRGRPINYYAKSTYSGYGHDPESENNTGEDEEMREPISMPKTLGDSASVRCQAPQAPAPQQHKTKSRTIYASNGLRIRQCSFEAFDEIADLPKKAPYAPENDPSKYAQRCKGQSSSPILHVALTSEEIEAMIKLLALFSVDTTLPDMSLADQIILVVNSIPTSRLEGCIISQITRMMNLQRSFTRHGFSTLAEYYDGIEQVSKATRKSIEFLLGDLSKSTKSSDPSQWLATVAKLRRRRGPDICAFISDARLGSVPTRPYYISVSRSLDSEQYFLMDRISLPQRQDRCSDYSLHRSQTWKGASNDVISLAWCPDGTKFAVGAAAHCDTHNMQYNRPNNLLLGDTVNNFIRDLPAHRLPYPTANANSPHLYMSVSAVQWFEDGLYTAGYDKTVRLWDISSYANAICTRTLRHDLRVQVMARHQNNPQVLATGTDSTLHLWNMDSMGEASQLLDFMKQRSVKNPRVARNVDFLPSTLAWGSSCHASNFLAAGFSGKEAFDGDPCREGLLAMWRLTESSMEPIPLQPNAQNIFDVKFHPAVALLATGSSVPPGGANGSGKHVRSLVRVYEPLKKTRCAIEFDCPALDINDVTFCPMDRSIISASCTDGITYVWDYRNPGEILHRLCHGNALNQLDEQLTREQADVGVRVALWDNSIDNFITGSSDGVLKSWNILRAPEDVLVRDIAAVGNGIMSGAFSSDKSNLLVGDDSGGIHVFSKGQPPESVATMQFDYDNGNEEELSELPSDSGRSIARQLLSTGELIQHQIYGVGQGPAYKGPYAAWARPEGTPKDMLPTTPLLEELQLLQLDTAGPGTHLEQQRRVAEARNKTHRKRKRHRDQDKPKKYIATIGVVNLCSDEEDQRQEQKPKPIFIDLTGDTDTDSKANDSNDNEDYDNDIAGLSDGESDLEEDYWFPDSRDVDANIRDSRE
ncbi:hypothetical protein PISL3812_03728 [Talaromyces islandicus]|uniref:Uncharacterized protein n=1 Tax=Talaromyces islandicus TaxID=28573 RepID=A0A0U1LTI3_TALIS|nr:hypothetical protein PISL3812_03728 [Talaromyces islandicus]